MYSTTHVINERSKSVPIKQNSSTDMKCEDTHSYNYNNEYSLKQNFFDPSKSSPPNEFMLKLRTRMSLYESKQSDSYNKY